MTVEGQASVLSPGLSISQRGFAASFGGTSGCIVVDNATGRPMLLGNAHVLNFYRHEKSLSNLFDLFGDDEALSAQEIVQPCGALIFSHANNQKDLLDVHGVSVSKHAVALAKTCVVATLDPKRAYLESNMDAAVAFLKVGTAWSNITPSGQVIKAPRSAPVRFGERVWNWGSASGKRKWARVMDAAKAEKVPFAYFTVCTLPMSGMLSQSDKVSQEVIHTAVIEVEGEDTGDVFQKQGDSGSPLCDDRGHLVGLMSSGGLGRRACAIPIQSILTKLNVSFPAPSLGRVEEGAKVRIADGAKLKTD